MIRLVDWDWKSGVYRPVAFWLVILRLTGTIRFPPDILLYLFALSTINRWSVLFRSLVHILSPQRLNVPVWILVLCV